MGFDDDEITTPGIQIFKMEQKMNLQTYHLTHQLHVLHKDRKTWTRQLKCLSVPANGVGILKIEQKNRVVVVLVVVVVVVLVLVVVVVVDL